MKFFSFLLISIFLFSLNVHADYVVLSQGVVIEGEEIHRTQSIASITIIMTAIIALENASVDEEIIVNEEAVQQIGSSLYLKINEKYTLFSLLNGLLLRSGNDAAYLIAMHVGGSIEKFADMMNQKAKQLHMNETLFVNPSGLDETDDGNLLSVYDMALCMEYAMKNPVFQIISSTRQYKAENERVWINKNRLLNLYENCTGGKTGYTKLSGKTLVTSASLNGFETIVVSFREQDYFYLHKQLHENMYSKYDSVLLIPKGNYRIKNKTVEIKEDIRILAEKESILDYEVRLNQNLTVRYKVLNEWIERSFDLT